MQVGESELLLSDSVDFVRNAKAAGVRGVELEVWPRMWHCFQQYAEGCGLPDDAPAGTTPPKVSCTGAAQHRATWPSVLTEPLSGATRVRAPSSHGLGQPCAVCVPQPLQEAVVATERAARFVKAHLARQLAGKMPSL